MQIKIEIDVKPEELRRFLGLPDVAGLQEDIVQFLREKVGQVNETFNATDFVKGNLETLKQSPAVKRLLTRINLSTDPETAAGAENTKAARKRSSGGRTRTRPPRGEG